MTELKIFPYESKYHEDFVNISLEWLKKYDLHEYISTISKGISSKSLSRKIATLKSLYNFLVNEEIISVNVSKSIRMPKLKKKLPNYLTIDEIKEFFNKTLNEIDISKRDLLIIDLLY